MIVYYQVNKSKERVGGDYQMKKKWLLPVLASLMAFSATPALASANSNTQATQAELTTTAKSFLNTPYYYGGTTKSGIDCSAFTMSVFKQFGIQLDRTSRGQYNQGTSVSKADLQVGDLVFFNTSGSGVSHVGIYIGNGNMISAESSEGVAISSINDPYYWGPRYIGAKRIAEFPSVKDAAIDFSVYASRSEVAKQLAVALELDMTNTESGFTDVKTNHKNAGAIAAVKEKGIFSGDENGKFNPFSPITKAQLANVLVAAFKLEKGSLDKTFSDVSSEHYAANSIEILASNGIVSGKADGSFGTSDIVTLEQLSSMIQKAKLLSK